MVKNLSANARRCKRWRFNPWVGKIPWRRARQPTPVFLPGESHGQRSLAGYSPWSHKESDTTELGFPYGSPGKESACNAGYLGPIPGLGRFPWRRERLGKGKERTSHYGSQNPNINDTLDQIWTKEIAAGRPHCTGHPTPNNPPN